MQIVDAAAAVLGRQGYENTSMKEIAQEVGVAPGLLHYYFDSKEELLTEVVEQLHREVEAEWLAAIDDLSDPLERIATGLDAAEAKCRERPEFFRLMFDMYSVGMRNPAILKRLRAMSDEFVADVAEESRKVSEQLPAQSPFDPKDLAAAVAGAIDGIAIQALIRGEDPHGAFRALKGLVLSHAAMAYVVAGEPPPMDRLLAFLQDQPGLPSPLDPEGQGRAPGRT